MKERLVEFFQSDTGMLSMSRLLMFMTFFVAAFIMVHLTLGGSMNEGYFAMFLSFGGGVYLGGKGIDMKSTPKGPEVKA